MKPAKPASATMNEQTFVPATMRAVYYDQVRAGDEVLAGANNTKKYREIDAGLAIEAFLDTDYPTPRPSEHQYILKIQAATWGHMELPPARVVNPKYAPTHIPLHSVCGTVISTPAEDHTVPGGPKFKIGDVVLGMLSYTRDGGAADYALATEDEVALKPMNISAAEAASVVTPALVAWQALFRYCGTDVPATSSGIPTNSDPMRVLVNNVDDNNIGRIAIQLLRAKNACLPFARPWICAVCGRQDSEALMDESGVDEVLVIPRSSSQTVDVAATFHARNWGPADIILDFSVDAAFRQTHPSSLVKDKGLVITPGVPSPELKSTTSRQQDILCSNDRGVRSEYVAATPDGAALAQIAELVEANVVTVDNATVVDLVDAVDFAITGVKEASGRLLHNEIVVRVN
ncbi:hypothetical protein N7497_011815 [Penicillium chrysogenum]|uniref:Enoyl reductase (ER) domain-containing protein n=1 Tax=Penicillium chrysogenum TaxID=5076 RepID=A0ABQ8WS18_PENCH|nr:hypothetical protein N7505_004091 [Penicillium chrysogenum]KAJ5286013.1 hypothetical protein N7524_001319 [Penicillium chrysogenum]KAJ6140922.1 hypothetical protein N7497_011815 [Penicillium chrysogenum]